MRHRGVLAAFTLAILAALPGGAYAATLEPVGTYTKPVFVTSEPQDPNRLLVVEQDGRIMLTEGSTTSTFLDIDTLVNSTGFEEGLLSVAPAPDYATSKLFYVFYTNDAGELQIDEFRADSIPVDPATRRGLLTIPHPATNHNAGQLQFGPGGYLYISTGDGGSTPAAAQDVDSLLGKILRIDPSPAGAGDYDIPADNPFVGADGRDEIWSYGLRNPFRFSFDRQTGAISIGDVGQTQYEELDYDTAPDAGKGDNYGWPCREGPIAGPIPGACDPSDVFTEPTFAYHHGSSNCSITAGYVARDQNLGDLYGRYVYADYCAGQIWSLIPGPAAAASDRAEGLSVANPSSFGEDACGRLYVASHTGGGVYRFVGGVPGCPAPGPPGPGPEDSGGPPPPDGGDDPRDTHPPNLTLTARDEQHLGGDRRLECRLRADEDSQADARLALLVRGEVVRRFDPKQRDLAAGETERVSWGLPDRLVRELRRRDGRVRARFRASATDAQGNAGGPFEAVSALRD